MKKNMIHRLEHRPHKIPTSPWTWSQKWGDCLFLHFEADSNQLRKIVPNILELDLYQKKAWISIVLSCNQNFKARFLPIWQSRGCHAQMEVRTYVKNQGKAGTYTLSLDAPPSLYFKTTRWITGSSAAHADLIYQSHYNPGAYVHNSENERCLSTIFKIKNNSFQARLSKRTEFLTERYCSYSLKKDLKIKEWHHLPWHLHHVEVDVEFHNIGQELGLQLTPQPQACFFSKGVDVISWSYKNVETPEQPSLYSVA
jgi:hypothetical protein